jgi:hypothetical protein
LGDDLHLTAELRNTGTTTVAEPHVLVHLDNSSFISRSSLDRWRTAAPDDGDIGTVVLQQDAPASLAPGETVAVDLTVPASSIQLSRRLDSWGARGLAVEVVDHADPARTRLGIARTFALWFPEHEITATRMSIVVPVTGPAVDPFGASWMNQLEGLTGTDGRLARLLAATGDHPEVTWVVDPWLADPTQDAGPVAESWAQDLLAATTDREVCLLPYLDPDLAALAHAGAGGLLTTAIDRAEATLDTTDLPESARVTLAWPADVLPDLMTTALAARAGFDAVLVGPGQLPSPSVLTYTPSGRTAIMVDGEDLPVLVPDERLSAALVTGVVGPVGTEPMDGVVTPATAAQDLLAELAVITRERPADGRHVLLTVGRDWLPDAAMVSAQLDALAAVPWVKVEPVSALVGLPDPEIDRGTLPDRSVAAEEVQAPALGTVSNAVLGREHLASIVADPSTMLGDLELEQLAPTSVAWRADPVGREMSVAASYVETQTLSGVVTVQPPTKPINLISTSGGLPVTVTNHLDEEVTVSVALRPSNSRLIADEAVTVTLEPGSETVVSVPVHAVQSANVLVTVELYAPDGALLDNSTQFIVRVRADWEGIGAAVIGVLLAIGLVAGVVRTIRRGRTARRAKPRPTSGPDDLSPEELTEEHAAGPLGHAWAIDREPRVDAVGGSKPATSGHTGHSGVGLVHSRGDIPEADEPEEAPLT